MIPALFTLAAVLSAAALMDSGLKAWASLDFGADE